jgi:hypothetical protein
MFIRSYYDNILQHPLNSWFCLWPNLFTLSLKVTAWSRVLLDKVVVAHLHKNFPAFYGTQGFITVFTKAHS